jgi:RHS repeat-associated protein
LAADGGETDVGPDQSTSDDQPDDGTPATCHSIVIGSGNLFEPFSDYEPVGLHKLSFVRYYNSEVIPRTFAARLGPRWRSNYDRYLNIMWVGAHAFAVTAERETGRIETFVPDHGSWKSDDDLDFRLTQAGSTWTLVTRDDTVEAYSANSKTSKALLTSIRPRGGYVQTLQYDKDDRLLSVTDSFGRSLRFAYANNLLQSLATPDGLVVSYRYNSGGGKASTANRLASVTYSGSPQTSQSYLYENPALPFSLTGLIDENGKRYRSWTYDRSGRAITSAFAGGVEVTKVAADEAARTRTIITALGGQNLYKFAIIRGMLKATKIDRSGPSVPAAIRKFTYDANGYLTSRTDWRGDLTAYVNDARGEPIRITEARGTAQERTTTIAWHPTFHLPVEIVTPGLTTRLTYDAAGNLLTRTLTDTTTGKLPYSTNGVSRTWAYTWSNGLLTSVRGPRTDVVDLTTFAYDGSGALTQMTNALGQVTRVTAHTPSGLPTAMVDANGVTTRLTYDARQRLRSRTVVTAAGERTTTFAYDPAGNVVGVTSPDGSALANTYDDAHRLIRVTDLFGEHVDYGFDATLDDRTHIAVFGADGAQALRKHADVFDALGRIREDIGGADQKTGYDYDADGHRVAITDPLGRVTQRDFDPLGRLVKITDAAKGVTSLAYDAHNRPASVTDPNGNATTYSYDGFGDLIQKTSPDTGVTVYRYDLAGNLVQSVDAAGIVTNHAYDALNRRVSTNYPADPAENVTYTYDQGSLGVGRLTTVKDAVGTLGRVYDERGNVVQETRTHGPATLVTFYSYDAANRVAAITYPSGWTVSYARDAMGRVVSIAAKRPGSNIPLSVVSNITYQPFGEVSGLTFGNGVVETRQFDRDYRLTHLAAAGKIPVEDLAYGYDAAGNVASITDPVTPGDSQTFGYDALDRLVSAKGGYGALGYTYDALGNRLTEADGQLTDAIYVYAPHSNRLAAVRKGGAVETIAYSPTGSVTGIDSGAGSVVALAYNNAGRLAGVTASGQAVAGYGYDAFGQRLVKSHVGTLGAETVYQYDQGRRLLEEEDASGDADVDYIYLDGRPIAQLSPRTGELRFVHNDRLGTPQAVTDNSQGVVWAASYEPFGAATLRDASASQSLRFPGQYFDADTKFYGNGFRDYEPILGRYLEADPLGLNGGLSLYSYASQNPMSRTDSLGLCDDDDQSAPTDKFDPHFPLGPPGTTGSFTFTDPSGQGFFSYTVNQDGSITETTTGTFVANPAFLIDAALLTGGPLVAGTEFTIAGTDYVITQTVQGTVTGAITAASTAPYSTTSVVETRTITIPPPDSFRGD